MKVAAPPSMEGSAVVVTPVEGYWEILRVATFLERDDLLQQYRNLDWKSKQNRGFGEVVGGECGRVSGNNVIDATLLVVYLHKKVVIAWEGLGW